MRFLNFKRGKGNRNVAGSCSSDHKRSSSVKGMVLEGKRVHAKCRTFSRETDTDA